MSALVLARAARWRRASRPAAPSRLSRTFFTPLKPLLFTPLFAPFLASLPPTSQRKERPRESPYSSATGGAPRRALPAEGPFPWLRTVGPFSSLVSAPLPWHRTLQMDRCHFPSPSLPRASTGTLSARQRAGVSARLPLPPTPQGPSPLSTLPCPVEATLLDM